MNTKHTVYFEYFHSLTLTENKLPGKPKGHKKNYSIKNNIYMYIYYNGRLEKNNLSTLEVQ